MASMMVKRLLQSKKSLQTINATRMPNMTATPPNTGMGTRCSLRALGLSTMSFNNAIRRILGKIQIAANMETTKGMRTWNRRDTLNNYEL